VCGMEIKKARTALRAVHVFITNRLPDGRSEHSSDLLLDNCKAGALLLGRRSLETTPSGVTACARDWSGKPTGIAWAIPRTWSGKPGPGALRRGGAHLFPRSLDRGAFIFLH
jgi:hypothetical protein